MAFTEKVTAILQLLLYHFFQNTVIPKYIQTLESYTLCNFYTTWGFYTRFTSYRYNSLFYRKIPDEPVMTPFHSLSLIKAVGAQPCPVGADLKTDAAGFPGNVVRLLKKPMANPLGAHAVSHCQLYDFPNFAASAQHGAYAQI